MEIENLFNTNQEEEENSSKKRKLNEGDVSNTPNLKEQLEVLQQKVITLQTETDKKDTIIEEMVLRSGVKSISLETLDHADVKNLLYIEEKNLIVSAGHRPPFFFESALKVWSITNNECLLTLTGHKRVVKILIYLQDREQLLSASWDGTIRIWSLASNDSFGQCMHILEGYSDHIYSVVYVDETKKIISGSTDNTLKIWSIADDESAGLCLRTLNGHSDSVKCVINIGNDQIVSASKDTTLKIWSLSSGECLNTLTGHTKTVKAVIYIQDKNLLMSASKDGNIKIWSLASVNKECIHTIERKVCVRSLMYLAEKEQLVSTDDNSINVWSIADGAKSVEHHRSFDHRSKSATVIYVPNRELFISGGYDNKGDCDVKLWSATSGKCLDTIKTGEDYPVTTLLFLDQTNKLFFSCEQSSEVKIWSPVLPNVWNSNSNP